MRFKYQFSNALDSRERTLQHREIIRNKAFLSRLYHDWYLLFREEQQVLPQGLVVEIGSGGGFLKSILPNVISSDIMPLPDVDMAISALELPFEDNSLSALFMVDTFHHLPDARKFLEEADRTLCTGGKLMMIEPANSWWGRFIYKRFHHEPFDPCGDWTFRDTGPLSGANTALPWIVFIRDRSEFQAEFPELVIEHIDYHTPLRYLVSGGVSFPSLMPGFCYPAFRLLDQALSGLSGEISLFVTIKIVKTRN